MTAVHVILGGVTYRTDDLFPAEHHALTVAVHEALCGLGLEPWVRVPGDVHAPNLARLTTSRAGHE